MLRFHRMIELYINDKDCRDKGLHLLSINEDEYFDLLDQKETRFKTSPLTKENIACCFILLGIITALIIGWSWSPIPSHWIINTIIYLGWVGITWSILTDNRDKRYYDAARSFIYIVCSGYQGFQRHQQYLEELDNITDDDYMYSMCFMYIDEYEKDRKIIKNILEGTIDFKLECVYLISPELYYDIKTMIMLAQNDEIEDLHLSTELKKVDIDKVCPI